MDHLVAAEGHGTRLTLTCTAPVSGSARSDPTGLELTELVRTTVTRYKHLIEKTSKA